MRKKKKNERKINKWKNMYKEHTIRNKSKKVVILPDRKKENEKRRNRIRKRKKRRQNK